VIDGNALGVCAAYLDITGVLTQPTNTGFREIAVTITSATIDASAVFADLSGSALVV